MPQKTASFKKTSSSRSILTLGVILLLVVGLIAGVVLSQKQQDNRQQAYNDPGTTKTGYTLVFNDEFTCDFNDANPGQTPSCLFDFYQRWFTRYVYDSGRQDYLNPELEIQRYRNNGNHVVSNGTLKLISKKIRTFNASSCGNAYSYPFNCPQIYESGMIRSNYSFAKNHYMEVRMKLPRQTGTFGAAWLAGKDAQWPPELEIAEFWNARPDPITWVYHSLKVTNNSLTQIPGQQLYRHPQTTLSPNEPNSIFYSFGSPGDPAADLSANFHVYGLDWQGDMLTWYIDGVKTYQINGPAWMHRNGTDAGEAQIMLNLAMIPPNEVPNYPADSVFPQSASMEIDYVRVYKKNPIARGDYYNAINVIHSAGEVPQPSFNGVNVPAPKTTNGLHFPAYTLKAYSATKSLNTSTGPAAAVDQSMTTSWNAGTGATQAITVDLGKVGPVSSISMMPNQSPAGTTTHKIYVSQTPPTGNSMGTLAATLTGSTKTGTPVEKVFDKPLQNVRYVTIQTTASPSWISWFDIKIFP